MEFISIGGLLPGLSAEDIRNGISQPRNRKLAEIFHRLRLIESYGTGIRKIFSLYRECAAQPKLEITPNTFKLVLPNQNAALPEESPSIRKTRGDSVSVTPQMRIVLDYLEEYGEIGEAELQELLNVRHTRAYLVARRMCENGLITISGRGRNKKYRLAQ